MCRHSSTVKKRSLHKSTTTKTPLGLRGKVLEWGSYKGGFCDKLVEAPSPTESVPASSKRNPPGPRMSPSVMVVMPTYDCIFKKGGKFIAEQLM